VNAPGDQDAIGKQQRVEKVLALFRHLGTLDEQIDLEHSFKLVHHHLFENRFLLGVNRREADANRDEQIASICEKIGMPQSLLESFLRALPRANHVYFGAEKDEHALLLKAYLEFRDRIEREIGDADVAGRSFLLFSGFKWDAFSPARQAVTRYDWYPAQTTSEMLPRLQSAMDPGRHKVLLEFVQEIVERAAEQSSHHEIQFLEVTEEGNPRRSFDINVYKAGLRLEDIGPHLTRAARHYAVPAEKFASLYQRIKTERLGHLAGGVDRKNADFMTVYYGVKQVQSAQFGSASIVT
jgi:hypothetical protein